MIVVVGVFAVWNGNGKNVVTVEPNDALSEYFEDKMIEWAVADVGQPIEGFDSDLLTAAYPGLVAADFDGVETSEGKYLLQGGSAVFVREASEPVSSAERMISSAGYETLLVNVSKRLNMPADSKENVEALIQAINTGERISIGLGKSGTMFGTTLIPTEVLEDSRCPVDVQCIQAGRVRVRTTVVSGMGTSTTIFETEKSFTTETEEITLKEVIPVAEYTKKINKEDYVFRFHVKMR